VKHESLLESQPCAPRVTASVLYTVRSKVKQTVKMSSYCTDRGSGGLLTMCRAYAAFKK